jgi:hypothetical protein
LAQRITDQNLQRKGKNKRPVLSQFSISPHGDLRGIYLLGVLKPQGTQSSTAQWITIITWEFGPHSLNKISSTALR